MSLRVTQSMVSSRMMRNLSANYDRMAVSQNQLSTERKINKPSDDPVGITYALRYRSETAMNEQYQRNINVANSYVDQTDTVLNEVNEMLQRVNELTTKGLNGTNPQTAMDAISKELGEIHKGMIEAGNSQLNGKYIFNGQKTDQKPYATGAETTDTEHIDYQLGMGVTAPINVTGNEVFGTGATSLFSIVGGLRDAFASGNQNAAATLYDQLKTGMDTFSQVRSEVGARSNRISLMENRLGDLSTSLEELTSKTEDADIAEVITQLQTDQSVYQASLSTGAKIIQQTLVDYLR